METQYNSNDFLTMNNYDYFIKNDALQNFDDISFTLLDRYKCNIHCKECFLENIWDNSKSSENFDFENFIKNTKYFYYVKNIDDLLFIKKNYHILYEKLKFFSKYFTKSLQNQSIITNKTMLINDLNFKLIDEISIWTSFYSKNKKKIKRCIDEYLTKYKIKIIKFIIDKIEKDDLVDIKNYINYLESKDICIFTQKLSWENKNDFSFDYHPVDIILGMNYNNIWNYPVFKLNNSFLYQKNFACHCWYDFFDDMFPNEKKHRINLNQNLDLLMFDMLFTKIEKYNYFYLNNWKKVFGNKYEKELLFNYLHNICNNIILNKDFNFIPLCIIPYHLHKFLEKLEYIKINNLGYLKKKSINENIIPMLSWKR